MTSSQPLVEVGVITKAAPHGGTALVCVNWSGDSIEKFMVTLHFECAFKSAALASGGAVIAGKGAGGEQTFSFALSDTADTVILR